MADTAPDGTIFETHGSPEAPPVFLIHGLGLNRACWQWTVPALENRFRVITYDLFGHGDSPPPPSTPSLSLFARQAGDLMDHLGVNTASFVGFSLGGMIARKIAQEMPERTTALLRLHFPWIRNARSSRQIPTSAIFGKRLRLSIGQFSMDSQSN